MGEKKAKARGPFFQVGGIDPELARRFRALCSFRGEEPGAVLSDFMRGYVAAHGPKDSPKPKK